MCALCKYSMSKKGQEAGPAQIRSASEEQHSRRLHLTVFPQLSLWQMAKFPLK